MVRCISVLLVSGLLMFALAVSVALAQPQPDLSGRGVPRADEDLISGKPKDPNAWGAVTSQFASNTTDDQTLGQHASDPPSPGENEEEDSAGGRGTHDTPRLGVGNVARNDAEQADILDKAGLGGTDPTATGTHPSDHACAVDVAFGADCEGDPGPLPA